MSSTINTGIYDVLLNFEPQNLGIARKIRGLTKTELAKLIDKTPGAISQFESGFTKPEPSTLKRISLATGFPVNFFSTKIENAFVSIDNCHFRSLRSATQKSRSKVIASGILLNNIVNKIEEHVNLPQEKVSELIQSVSCDDDIEKLAVNVRKQWGYGLGPIPNLIRMMEVKGILVSYLPEDSVDVNAFSTWDFGRPYIFLVPYENAPSRVRFSCAHELGHLIMHSDAKPGDKILEAQANRFAGAFLFPRDAFIREYPSYLNWEHLYELKKRWKMSVSAIIRRAYDLNCISERTYRRAFVQLSEMNHRKNEPFEPEEERSAIIENSMQILRKSSSIESISSDLNLKHKDIHDLLALFNYCN